MSLGLEHGGKFYCIIHISVEVFCMVSHRDSICNNAQGKTIKKISIWDRAHCGTPTLTILMGRRITSLVFSMPDK